MHDIAGAGQPRFDATGLGETMVRLSARPGEDLERAAVLEFHVGGAESNVLSTLARLGRRCAWLGLLPDNRLGDVVAARLAADGVDVGGVRRVAGGRLGLYVVERGVDRGAGVTYDRRGSAASAMRPGDVEWDRLLDTRIVHATGITAALSSSCRETLAELRARAAARGVAVSLDVNYRPQLWAPDEARRGLEPLLHGLEILTCSERDARTVLGLGGDGEEVAGALRERYGARWTVLTLGERGVLALTPDGSLAERARPVDPVDPIGAGDALVAGVIDGWLDGSARSGLARGTALAALALAAPGDVPRFDPADLPPRAAGAEP